MTEQEQAYTAGIIDGEGTVMVERRATGRRYPFYLLTVGVTNTDLRLLMWLKQRHPEGRIITKVPPPPDKNWQQAYQIQWRSDSAANLLRLVLASGLLVKRPQAVLALEFHDSKQGRIGKCYSNEQREEFERFYHAMRQLNTRGRNRVVDAERLSEAGPQVALWNVQ